MNADIDGVVFDIGNVLVRVDYGTVAKKFARHSPLSPQQIFAALVATDVEVDAETGKCNGEAHFLRVKERVQGDPSWRYDEFVPEFQSGLTMTSGGEDALRYAAASKRVFLMSNTTEVHTQWILAQDAMATLPERYFLSFREGVMKPDPRIWEIFFARTGLEPHRCLYIDDGPEHCASAARFGVHTIIFKIEEMRLLDELRRWF